MTENLFNELEIKTLQPENFNDNQQSIVERINKLINAYNTSLEELTKLKLDFSKYVLTTNLQSTTNYWSRIPRINEQETLICENLAIVGIFAELTRDNFSEIGTQLEKEIKFQVGQDVSLENSTSLISVAITQHKHIIKHNFWNRINKSKSYKDLIADLKAID